MWSSVGIDDSWSRQRFGVINAAGVGDVEQWLPTGYILAHTVGAASEGSNSGASVDVGTRPASWIHIASNIDIASTV